MCDALRISTDHVPGEFPIPIATRWTQLLEAEHLFDRHRCLQSLISRVLNYCTLIAVAESRQWCGDLPARVRPQAMEQSVREALSNMEVESSINLLSELANIYRSAGVRIPVGFSELFVQLWNQVERATCLEKLIRLAGDYRAPAQLEEQGGALDEDYLDDYYTRQSQRLAHVLENLGFLREYRLVWRCDGDAYALMGPEWPQGIADRWTGPDCAQGSLFLQRSGGEDQLPLDPLIFLGHCDRCAEEGRDPPCDVFLFYQFGDGRAIWTGRDDTHRKVSDPEPVRAIAEDFGQARRAALVADWEPPIDWATTVDRAIAHSNNRLDVMKTNGRPYKPGVYLSRKGLEERIEDFLAESDATGLIVTGDTGVGKTNLLCHLADIRIGGQEQSDIVLLFSFTDHDRARTVEDLVGTALLLGDDPDLDVLFRGLDTTREQEDDSRLILILDCIDRHEKPVGFLRAVANEFVRAYGQYGWLKVVISCRAETWERLKLDDVPHWPCFYTLGGTVALRLQPFEPNERRKAYENYAREYGFGPAYDTLSPGAKQFLRDPFNLGLVFDTYKHSQSIPTEDLGTATVFREYGTRKIYNFIHRNVLVDKVVSLMYREENDSLDRHVLWREAVSGDSLDLETVQAAYHELLEEKVIRETTLAEGARSRTMVSFTHDRLFEYLLGQHLVEKYLLKEKKLQQGEEEKSLQDLIKESHDYPSVWWALRAGLSIRFGEELVADLATEDDPEVRGLLVDALSLAARDNRENVARFLNKLLESPVQSCQLLGVMAACETGNATLLRGAIESDDGYIHGMGVQYAYYYWKRDSDAGKELIVGIAEDIIAKLSGPRDGQKGWLRAPLDRVEKELEAIGRGLDRRWQRLLQSYIELSGLLGTHLMGEVDLVEPFISKWGEILRRLRANPRLWEEVRERVVAEGRTALAGGFESRENQQQAGGLMNRSTLVKFFELPPDIRGDLADVVAYVDTTKTPDEEVQEKIITLSTVPDAMICFMLTPVLVCQCIRDRDWGRQLIRDVFGAGEPMAQYTAQKALAVWLTPLVLKETSGDGNPDLSRQTLDEAIKELEDFQMKTWVDPRCKIEIAGQTHSLGVGHIAHLIMFDALIDPGRNEIIKKFTDTLPDSGLMGVDSTAELQRATNQYMIRALAYIGALGSDRYVESVLPAFKLWLDDPDLEVQRSLAKGLALLRTQAPRLVEAQLHRWAETEENRDRLRDLRRKISSSRVPESADTRLSRSGLMALQSFPFLEGAPRYVARAVSNIAGKAEHFDDAMEIVVETILDAAQEATSG